MMKRLWSVLVFCLMLALPALADEGYDLRKTRWGMSMAEVQAAEGREPAYSNEGAMIYTGISMAASDFDLVYYFDKGRLYQAIYAWSDKSFGSGECFIVYSKLKGLLNAKYGPSLTDDVIWKNDLFRDDPTDWELAVTTGGLVLSATWETERTKIMLLLTGKNYEMNLLAGYESKEMRDEVERDATEEDLESL